MVNFSILKYNLIALVQRIFNYAKIQHAERIQYKLFEDSSAATLQED